MKKCGERIHLKETSPKHPSETLLTAASLSPPSFSIPPSILSSLLSPHPFRQGLGTECSSPFFSTLPSSPPVILGLSARFSTDLLERFPSFAISGSQNQSFYSSVLSLSVKRPRACLFASHERQHEKGHIRHD